MTIGVGGSTPESELGHMRDMAAGIREIGPDEWRERIERAQSMMRDQGIVALYLDTSPNLFYFTGLNLKATERLHGAIIPAEGPLHYLSPAFEEPKTRSLLEIEGEILCWEEHEDPTSLVMDAVSRAGYDSGMLAVDPATPFLTFDGFRRNGNRYDFANGAAITAACRSVKTPAEIALLERANAVTLEVHKAAARIMRKGITTPEVEAFVVKAHRRLGATPPAAKPLVLFGEATAYPHGVGHPQALNEGDMVLLDLGCFVGGYRSDITRSYVFGEPNKRQREVWELEKKAQAAGFAAAKPGVACEEVDRAARGVVERGGFEADYGLPGLPHRTGHGIGIEVHEETYMVRGNRRPLESGMCFSVEPTICIYGEFGIRLEDCAYMTESGAQWFTTPCHTVDDPFGYEA